MADTKVEETKQRIGSVYKAYHASDPSRIYVGSTIQSLSRRLTKHKEDCKRKTAQKTKWYEYIRSKNYTGFLIEQLERVTFTHTMELRVKENDWIRRLQPEFNTLAAYVSAEEYKQKNKVYKQNHKQQIQEYDKARYEANRPVILEQMRSYKQRNKDTLAQKRKLKYEANKPALIEKRKREYAENKTKYTCLSCDYTSNKFNYNKHLATANHKRIESNILWCHFQSLFA